MQRAVPDRVTAIVAGERAPLARAISDVENDAPGARALLEALRPRVGRAHVVGVTGPPGAGKSTLIDALLRELARRERRVAVAAVDPSSAVSGGAVLGDRVRMAESGASDAVFIRSLASRGQLGGLAKTTRGIVDLFDAAGYDVVIIETVGAGQSDIDVASLADTSVVVCPPGLGDDVQAIKAGILEIADVLVVNKSDLPHAERTQRELMDMLHLRARKSEWRVPVLRTTASTGEGVPALVDRLDDHRRAHGLGKRLRAQAVLPDPSDVLGRARALATRDGYATHLGIELVDAGPGTATLRMRVGPQHLNFNGRCHGGAMFSLADSAFGIASNSHGVVAAAVDAHVTFPVAVEEGDVLTATAVEASLRPKLGVYRVEITRDDGTLVASFTGTVYVTKRPHAATL